MQYQKGIDSPPIHLLYKLLQEKDKRVHRHTVGLHIAAWPCGIIPDFAELFGSESISQVYFYTTIVVFE